MSQKKGQRADTYRTYLKPAMARGNLKVRGGRGEGRGSRFALDAWNGKDGGDGLTRGLRWRGSALRLEICLGARLGIC